VPQDFERNQFLSLLPLRSHAVPALAANWTHNHDSLTPLRVFIVRKHLPCGDRDNGYCSRFDVGHAEWLESNHVRESNFSSVERMPSTQRAADRQRLRR
jgi:hypothetical protein